MYAKRMELTRVIDAIKNLEQDYLQHHENGRAPRIAIGFGGCTDVFSRAIDCFIKLNMSRLSKCETNGEFASRNIHTLDDLNAEFSTFFDQGAAAERYVHDSEIFEQLQNVAFSVKGITKVLGGNAPVMANRLAQEGADVLLGAKLSRYQMEFLHANVSAVVMAADDESEDRHLILEYDVGDLWGSVATPRANRFIVHRDQHTPYLTGLDELKVRINEFKPDLFILGGLQMMDGFPYLSGEMSNQIYKLEAFLASLDQKVPIHFEMASFVEKDLLLLLKKHVIPFADSLGNILYIDE